jgi:hypothetical protein
MVGVQQNPAFRVIKDLLDKTRVEGVSGSIGDQMSDEG